MEYHDPLNASLVLPFQRPRDGRSTLPILPSLPQLGLLHCREPNPRRHHGTPPSPRKIRRCCADRLNPPAINGQRGGIRRPHLSHGLIRGGATSPLWRQTGLPPSPCQGLSQRQRDGNGGAEAS